MYYIKTLQKNLLVRQINANHRSAWSGSFPMIPLMRFLLFAVCLPLAACVSASLEDAVAPAEDSVSAAAGPANTGNYPDLSAPRPGAAPQLTEEEREALRAEIANAEARLEAAGGGRRSGAADLRRAARAEQEETLRTIEGE